MQELIEARLNRLRQIAQGQEPSDLPETELTDVFYTQLNQDLANELAEQAELEEDVWAQAYLR